MPLDFYCTDFEDGDILPEKYTCEGDGVNPAFHISGVPEEAESLVIIVDDPDAPSGDFLHWMVWNLPIDTQFITEGELPEEAVEGFNDFGNAEYGAPCPPSGSQHRYQFKLYAIDTDLDLDEDISKSRLEKEIAGHIVDEVIITTVFGR